MRHVSCLRLLLGSAVTDKECVCIEELLLLRTDFAPVYSQVFLLFLYSPLPRHGGLLTSTPCRLFSTFRLKINAGFPPALLVPANDPRMLGQQTCGERRCNANNTTSYIPHIVRYVNTFLHVVDYFLQEALEKTPPPLFWAPIPKLSLVYLWGVIYRGE